MKIRIPARTPARAAAAMAALVVGLAGCSSENTAPSENAGEPAAEAPEPASASPSPADTSTSATPSTPSSTDARFAVFPDDVPAQGWELTESYEVPEGGLTDDRPIEPSLDWSAEYRGPGANPNVAPFVALSGHTTALAERRELQGELDREVTEGEIGGREAFWATDPEDVEGGATVAIAFNEDYTVELTGTGVALDTLREYAAALEPATAEEWAAAGGTLAD